MNISACKSCFLCKIQSLAKMILWKINAGADQLAELMKGLLGRHEDLNSIPAPMGEADEMDRPCNSSNGEAETEGSLGLAGQPVWLSSNHKVRVIEEDTNSDLVPPYIHAPVCAWAYAHTHAKINLKNYFLHDTWFTDDFFLVWLWKPKTFDPWKRMFF